MRSLNLLWVTDTKTPIFSNLFREYFQELGINLKGDTKVWEEMNNDMNKYDIKTFVLLEDDEVIGFSMFQVDTKENPWCMYEGAGDIREFYVKPAYRNNGYGTSMFELVKDYFIKLGIEEIYITTSLDDGELFWIRQGFQDTGIINSKNKLKEFVYYMN